jgi:hypothetical protein
VITVPPWARPLVLVAGLIPLSAGCGSDEAPATSGTATSSRPETTTTNEARACGAIVEERLDPSYLVHVVGDGEDVEYTTDPPTSGPHKAGPPVEGVLDQPLARPVQVGVLERGDVLIQHRTDLPTPQQEQLATLAGPGVVIAPNPDLPAPVVATAWTHKQTCDSVDLDALQGFIDARRGKGPDD